MSSFSHQLELRPLQKFNGNVTRNFHSGLLPEGLAWQWIYLYEEDGRKSEV